ncbi:hypothetical protein HYU40_04755 [Candidatus Woesearchaeota archaeon]|nr:hypothetical protein [Candidatus Woesearchaeota archaeon]
MLSTKKAQGMSLNTVIIAIIVLVVLVVLVMIFTGYFGKVFTPTVASCQSAGGTCADSCGNDESGRPIGVVSGAKCLDDKGKVTTQKCCQRPESGLFT